MSIPNSNSIDPKPSQGVDLTIILSEYDMPGVINVTDEFLASPWGHGVDSVTVESSGTDFPVQLATLQAGFQSGIFTSHVIEMYSTWTAMFADNGWIIKLDPYLTSTELNAFGPGSVNSCEYQGNYYAYPYFMNLGILYYRKDLMDEYFGIDMWSEADFDTWEELNETANYILNNASTPGNYPDLVGYVGQLDAYEGGVINFFEWCGSNGALDLVTSMNDVNINGTRVKEAMDFISALVAPQYTGVQGTPYIIPRNGLIMDEALSASTWLANNSIFCRQWPYIYSLPKSNDIEFGLAPLPHFAGATGYKTSCVDGTNLAIPTTTTGIAREAAINFTKFLGMRDAQESELTVDIDPSPSYFPQGNFPALLEVYDNPPPGFDWIKNWSEQAELTLSRPVHPIYAQISDIIAEYFSDLLSGQKSVDRALSQMQHDIEELIQLPPGSFLVTSTADDPDPDGIFNLTWAISNEARNYSVYEYDKFIDEINGSLISLINETTDLTLPLSGYPDGTYYFIVVAHNEYGDTLSNCIDVAIQIEQRNIPGYDIMLLIFAFSLVLIVLVKKQLIKILKFK
ncbi:MAG: extracellular solute-binding protein [Candidatus Odinarchaeota archaeon]